MGGTIVAAKEDELARRRGMVMGERQTIENILADLDIMLIRARLLTAETRQLAEETRAFVDQCRRSMRSYDWPAVWTWLQPGGGPRTELPGT